MEMLALPTKPFKTTQHIVSEGIHGKGWKRMQWFSSLSPNRQCHTMSIDYSRFLDHTLIDFVRLVLEDFDGFLDPQLKFSFACLNQIVQ